MQQLTTPEPKSYDTVFPGENWFFFWRTSPSLWESKLKDFSGPKPIFIPIYWGLFNESVDRFDFGEYRPETDLKRLSSICQDLNKEIVLVLPLSPAPFLPNAGLPSYLARNLLHDSVDLAHAVIDNDGRVNKMYSFFDPRIFQSFRKFVWHLGQYLVTNGISLPIKGVESFYLNSSRPISFFEDTSDIFKQGYSRYLKQLEASNEDLKSLDDHKANMKEYSSQIKSLYTQVAQESLASYWAGTLKIGFLGASSTDIFPRSSELWDHYAHYFKPLFEMLSYDIIPSSILLSPRVKQFALQKALDDIVVDSFLKKILDEELFEDDFDMILTPLVFFEIYNFEEAFDKLDLVHYIQRIYPWSYRFKKDLEFSDESLEHKIFYFTLKNVSMRELTEIIKLFLSGAKILINSSDASEEILARLQSFYIENDIMTEKINYVTNIEKARLSDGIIITYDGAKTLESPVVKQHNFWDSIISFLGLQSPKVQSDDEIFYFWKRRSSNAYELNYQEIRRVYLYNTTSYKKRVHIPSQKNFAFLKSIDVNHAKLESTTLGIDIELLPNGTISLDYGYYE